MAPTRIVVHGRAAHGSTPRAGDNALVTAAEVVRRLDAARPATVIGDDWRDWVDGDGRRRRRCAPGCSTPTTCGTTSTRLPAEHRVHAHACTHTTYTPTEVAGGLESNIVPDEVTLGRRRAHRARRDDRRRRAVPRPRCSATCPVTSRSSTAPSRPARAAPRRCGGALERAVQHAHPGGRLAPTLFTGGTDGRHLRALGVPAFGFGVLSAALDPATYWSRFHGDDERIDIESLRLSTAAWRHVALDFLG